MYKSLVLLGCFLVGIFLDAIVNEIVSLVSVLDCLLLVYRSTSDLLVLILFPVTLLS